MKISYKQKELFYTLFAFLMLMGMLFTVAVRNRSFGMHNKLKVIEYSLNNVESELSNIYIKMENLLN